MGDIASYMVCVCRGRAGGGGRERGRCEILKVLQISKELKN